MGSGGDDEWFVVIFIINVSWEVRTKGEDELFDAKSDVLYLFFGK